KPGLHRAGAGADRPTTQREDRCMSADTTRTAAAKSRPADAPSGASDAKAAETPRTPARRALGRGLGALLGEVRREEPVATTNSQVEGADSGDAPAGDQAADPREGLASLAVSAIEPHPDQP